MRIIGFQTATWRNYLRGCPKLDAEVFTTFRLPRRDGRDYAAGELLQVVVKPRETTRCPLGIAVVVKVELIDLYGEGPGKRIDLDMARMDGFKSVYELESYLRQQRPGMWPEACNRYTLMWVTRTYQRVAGREEYGREVAGGVVTILNAEGAPVVHVKMTSEQEEV